MLSFSSESVLPLCPQEKNRERGYHLEAPAPSTQVLGCLNFELGLVFVRPPTTPVRKILRIPSIASASSRLVCSVFQGGRSAPAAAAELKLTEHFELPFTWPPPR